MCLNGEELKVLREMGFHASSDNGKLSVPYTERGWSRRFGRDRDAVTAVLYVKKTVIGFEYRFTLSNADKPKDLVQWFDAAKIPAARRAFREMDPVWEKVRRALEGGFACRMLRKLRLR